MWNETVSTDAKRTVNDAKLTFNHAKLTVNERALNSNSENRLFECGVYESAAFI